VGDIQCCVLKQDRNRAWVIFGVVYCNRREIERGDVQCCVLKQEKSRVWVI